MRNVLITGGSSGIGRACVARFVAGGDRVWFIYRTGRERADRIVAELAAGPGRVAAFEFDQGNWASHQRLVEGLPGPVDVLVNNAAVGSSTVELAHEPVDVFAVCPGAAETAMLEASTLARLNPAQRRDLEARLPGGRLLRPDEVAGVVWWLASPDAALLHGAVIDASMGLGVHPGLLTGQSVAPVGVRLDPVDRSAA